MYRTQVRDSMAPATGLAARCPVPCRLARLCTPWAAALLVAGLLQAPASAQSVVTWAKASGGWAHCCQVGYGYDTGWVGGEGVSAAVIPQYDTSHFGFAIDAQTRYGSMQANYVNYAHAGFNDVVRASSGTEVQSANFDRLVVRSDTLPLGTPISLQVMMSLNMAGGGRATATVSGLPHYFRLDVTDIGTQSQFINVLIENQLTVGSVMNLHYQMFSSSGVQAGNVGGLQSGSGLANSSLFLQALCTSCQASFSGLGNSPLVSALGNSPLVYLAADSGHNYAQPIPEPGTWALMLGGLAVVGGLRRRLQGERS